MKYARVSTTAPNLDTQINLFQCPALMICYRNYYDTIVFTRFFRLERNRDHVINFGINFVNRKGIFKALDISKRQTH